MKKTFIYFSVIIIAFIAFFDAKDRLKELDEVAANTPSQVEFQQMIKKPDAQMNKDNIQKQNTIQTLKEKMNQNDKSLQQNQLDNVDKRRDTINNQVQ